MSSIADGAYLPTMIVAWNSKYVVIDCKDASWISSIANETSLKNDGMCIFKTETDSYYFLPMPEAELSAFTYNDPELVAELEPMDEGYLESLQVIEDDNAKVAPLGLVLIKTILPAEADPTFLLYDPESQVHFLFSQADFERLSQDIVTKLKTMGLAVTWTNRPYRVHLDDDGLVCRAEAVSL